MIGPDSSLIIIVPRRRFVSLVAVLGADLLDHVVEARNLLLPLLELVADVLFAREQTHDRLARHFLDFRRERDLERVRKGDQQHVADLSDRQHQILLAEILRNALEGVGRELVRA
jgi:hypothetical protein